MPNDGLRQLHAVWTCPACALRLSHPTDDALVANEAGAHMERRHDWLAQPQGRELGDWAVHYPAIGVLTQEHLLEGIIRDLGGTLDLWVMPTKTVLSPWCDGDAWIAQVDAAISAVCPLLPRRWYRHDGWQWHAIEVGHVE